MLIAVFKWLANQPFHLPNGVKFVQMGSFLYLRDLIFCDLEIFRSKSVKHLKFVIALMFLYIYIYYFYFTIHCKCQSKSRKSRKVTADSFIQLSFSSLSPYFLTHPPRSTFIYG